MVTLTFSDDLANLGTGSFRLRIGDDYKPIVTTDVVVPGVNDETGSGGSSSASPPATTNYPATTISTPVGNISVEPICTTADNPTNHVVTASAGYEGVVQIGGATGTLLENSNWICRRPRRGRMGRCASGLTVYFNLPSGQVAIAAQQIIVDPGWDGKVNDGNDLALVELSTAAPAGVQGFESTPEQTKKTVLINKCPPCKALWRLSVKIKSKILDIFGFSKTTLATKHFCKLLGSFKVGFPGR